MVSQSGDTLKEIVTSVKRATDIVTEIAAASKEQATGIEQVNVAVSRMDHVTQSNASQTAELSSTAVSLATEARHLQEVVDLFNQVKKSPAEQAVDVDHHPSTAAPSSAPPKSTKAKQAFADFDLEDNVERELQSVGAGNDGFGTFEEF
ncbi:Methyl-accepting chemotaxis protein III [Aeoliella mucimassa]|uniref:Methyl-accepting chemotaxis protein III n=1 Tax=Aeoliella mucimassa TaxID=2527972 RepID=A0A518AJZ7_9BACT|nr:Methyl-accepting chemotaxis protein III [Aeoliella mucimassa]